MKCRAMIEGISKDAIEMIKLKRLQRKNATINVEENPTKKPVPSLSHLLSSPPLHCSPFSLCCIIPSLLSLIPCRYKRDLLRQMRSLPKRLWIGRDCCPIALASSTLVEKRYPLKQRQTLTTLLFFELITPSNPIHPSQNFTDIIQAVTKSAKKEEEAKAKLRDKSQKASAPTYPILYKYINI